MDYKKSIIVLVSGSAAAQAVPILVSPVLTRLYSPTEFGILALYLSVCAVLSVFAAGRYDLALIEPAHDAEARGLMFGGLWLTVLFCAVLAVGLSIAGPWLATLLGVPSAVTWLHFVPVTVLSMSCLSIFTYWLNRRKNFKGMNVTRILNAFGIAGISLALAFTQLQSIGLLLGYMCGQLLTVAYQWVAYVRVETKEDRTPMLLVLGAYARYPRLLIPSTLAGTVAAESPIVLLTKFFDATVSGLFFFVNRVTVSPMSIIGSSVGEVHGM
jgi:O-antigen/teichoic acid export membrane protein